MMTRLLARQGPRRVVSPSQAAVIRRPETAASPGDLAAAARLLGDLGAAAIATVALESGKAADAETTAFATKVNDVRGW